MITPAPERRKFPRLDNNIPVKICSEEADVVTETLNLSAAGAYCKVNKYFEPMTKLQVLLLLPLRRRNKVVTKKVVCQGVVVRTEAITGGEYYNIAIYFNEIQKKDSATISEYITALLEQKEQQENNTQGIS